MEVKSLFDPTVKQEIISRINRLTPATQHLWGKMDVAQMLTHVQRPIQFAYGHHEIKGNLFMKIFGPLFKKILYNEKPYRRSLPTDKSYVVKDRHEFEREKQTLLELIDRFTEENIVREHHPVFGHLSKQQWALASWKHLDHHLKQFGQ